MAGNGYGANVLALAAMPQGLVVICFLAALVCFLIAAFAVAVGKLNLIGLGLAFCAFVWLWSAAAA